MKTFYFFLALLPGFFACSSPGVKSPSPEATPKDDTANAVTITDTSQPTYKPILFTEEDVNVPPYGLGKVKALIEKIKSQNDPEGGDESTEALDPKVYASLSFNERFTYHMIHPESFSQNCDILPMRADEEHRIFGHLQDIFGEFDWSEHQLKFLKDNRDSVMQLMKPVIEKDKKIGGNFKEAIVEMNANELIPYLIDFYNREKKDHDILTVLMLLMKNNNYPEFMNSPSYKKLYAQQEGEYAAYLVYNKANQELIIQRATNFYNGLPSK
jgi:hypothetical protein